MISRTDFPILLYHGVCRDDEPVRSEFMVQQSVFRAHLAFMANQGFHTPSPADLVAGRVTSSTHDVLITFDDGYLNNFECALPILQEFGFTALIFLVTDFTRRTNWWDDAKGIGGYPLMGPSQVQAMHKAGIEFGSHTVNHRSLPSLTDAELLREIVQSKLDVEQLIGQAIHWFAYPYGDVDERVKAAVRSAGYAAAVASNSGPFHPQADWFEIRRVPMANEKRESYLRAKLFGRDKTSRWLRWRVKRFLGMHNRFQSELGYGQ